MAVEGLSGAVADRASSGASLVELGARPIVVEGLVGEERGKFDVDNR